MIDIEDIYKAILQWKVDPFVFDNKKKKNMKKPLMFFPL